LEVRESGEEKVSGRAHGEVWGSVVVRVRMRAHGAV